VDVVVLYGTRQKAAKTFDEAKAFCYTQPQLAHRLLQMITDTTIAYVKAQVKAGADAIQLFDSWAGLLGKDDFEKIFSLPYLNQIVAALKNETSVIVFCKKAHGMPCRHLLQQAHKALALTGALLRLWQEILQETGLHCKVILTPQNY